MHMLSAATQHLQLHEGSLWVHLTHPPVKKNHPCRGGLWLGAREGVGGVLVVAGRRRRANAALGSVIYSGMMPARGNVEAVQTWSVSIHKCACTTSVQSGRESRDAP